MSHGTHITVAMDGTADAAEMLTPTHPYKHTHKHAHTSTHTHTHTHTPHTHTPHIERVRDTEFAATVIHL